MISIIIPAFNEAKYIKSTLFELEKCFGIYSEVEVIVVNNGSQDKTSEYARQFSWVKVIDLNSPVTVAEARNIGVSQSSGKYLAFIDADILVSEEWWMTLVNYCKNYFDEMIVSGCKVSVSKNPSWIELNWFACFKKSPSSYINSGNLVCSKKVYDLIGGFDPKLKTGEDVDFCSRAAAKGVAISADEKFKVYHEGYPKGLKAFFLREKWHGTGDLQTIANFFRSKVAMVSFAIVVFTVLLLCALFFQVYYLVLLLAFLIITINLFSLFSRFRVVSLKHFFICFFLNYTYFLARFFSIFELYKSGNRNR